MSIDGINYVLRYKVATVNPDYVTVNGVPVSQETDYDLSQGRTLLHFTTTLNNGDTIEHRASKRVAGDDVIQLVGQTNLNITIL